MKSNPLTNYSSYTVLGGSISSETRGTLSLIGDILHKNPSVPQLTVWVQRTHVPTLVY